MSISGRRQARIGRRCFEAARQGTITFVKIAENRLGNAKKSEKSGILIFPDRAPDRSSS